MADRIATGEIFVEVNDREAIASLHRIDAEFDKEMAKIDRQKADVKLGADLDNLKRDLKEAEAEVKAYDKRIKDAENKRSKAALAHQQKLKKAAADAKREEVRAAEEAVKGQRKQNKELETTEKRLVAIAKREEKIAKTRDKIEKQQTRAAKQEDADAKRLMSDLDREANRRKKLRDQRQREERQRNEASDREARRVNKHHEALQREIAQVPKLETVYRRLEDRLEKLALAKRKAGKDVRSRFIVETNIKDTIRDMEGIRKRVNNAVGRDPIGLPVKPTLAKDAGHKLRLDFENNNRQLGPAAAAAGIRIGRTMGGKVAQGFRNITERGGLLANTKALGSALGGAAGRGATSGLTRIGHAFDGLANMTVRLGPFTATIRQLMVVMSLLGPTIVDLVGALGSLVSVTGSAAVGLGTLGAAIVGGGIPALIGMVTVLKPVVGEMKNAMTASKNYKKAVLEHGKASDEAAKKLDIFNHVMKGQTAETKANFLAAGNLKTAWAKVTDPSRAAAFRVMGQGLSFLTRNVDFFGARTNATFSQVERGLDRWIAGLDSAEGHQVLGRMMDNFNDALGPAIDGVGNLLAVWGRFGASASRFLPEFANDFRIWTQSLLEGSKSTEVVDGKVNRMMESLKSVGRFLMSGGRLMAAFFGGGVASGQRFTDTMTNAMNRWTAFLKTGDGQDTLHDFFDRAVNGAQALYSALAPVLSAFVSWSSAISPFATAFFRAAGYVANFVAKLLDLVALNGPITALAATLGTLWAIGKIQVATAAVASFGRALLGIKAAQAGAAGAGALAGVAEGAGGAAALSRVGAAAGGAATKTSLLRRAVGGLGGILSGRIALLNPWTAGITALGVATYITAKHFKEAYEENKRLQGILGGGGPRAFSVGQNVDTANKAFREQKNILGQVYPLYSQQRNAALGLESAEKAYAEAVKRSGKNSLEARQAHQFLTDQRVSARNATEQLDKAEQAYNRTSAIAVNEMQKSYLTAKEARDEFYDQHKAQGFTDAEIKAQNTYKLLQQDVKRYWNGVHQAEEQATLATYNWGRTLKGLKPLTVAAAHDFARLEELGGKNLTKKISLKFEDPGKAQAVARSAGRALKSGVPKTLTSKIVTDSKSAEEAVRRLNKAKITDKRLKIIEEGGDKAIKVLEGIIGRKLNPKEQAIAERGGKGVIAMIRDIGRRRLAAKLQRILERGGQATRNVLHGINAIRLASKNVRVSASGIGAALDGINSVARAIAAIPTQHNTNFTKTGRGPTGGFATGGGPSVVPSRAATNPRQQAIDRAAERAPSMPRPAVSQKVTAPRYLVGEEGGSTEYVVSNNPAYRKRNRKYATMAARAVGLNVISAAAGYGPEANFHPTNTSDGLVGNNEFDDAGGLGGYRIGKNAPPPKTPGNAKPFSLKEYRAKGKKGGSRRNSAVHRANAWDSWLKKMGKGESMLGRELGIQESALQEPDSFLIETKRPDPDNPGETLSDFSIDTDKRDAYGVQLTSVREWYDTLLNWIATEGRNLQDALAAFVEQKKAGQAMKLEAAEAEKHHKKLLKTEQDKGRAEVKHPNKGTDYGTKGSTSARVVRRLRKAIAQDEKNKTKGEGWIDTANTRSGGISERTSEIGYDFRENVTRRNSIETERAALLGTADKQLSDALDTSGGKGSGGGNGDSETGLSYGGQGAAFDSERMSALREFGGNANPNVGGTSGAPSGVSALLGGGQVSSGALVAQAISGGAGANASGGAALNTITGGGGASAAVSSVSGDPSVVGAAGVAGGGGVTKVINQTNNFEQPPADAHTFSQGVAFELGAAI